VFFLIKSALKKSIYTGCLKFRPGFTLGLFLPVVVVLLTLFFFSSAFSEESQNLDSYLQECENGKTIYCIAAGMEEQKSGNLETALKYYQSACESHMDRGHLRACTPLLSLARQTGRLDEASAGLEKLCKGGDDVVCFYLAKEYFKITEFHRGFVHLERLCQNDFQPPDKADYGPCYHLGNNLKMIGEMKRALKNFNFDCDRDPLSAKPSCDQAEAIRLLARQGKADGVKVTRGLKMIEALAFGVVMIPLSGLLLLKNRRKFVLALLWIPAPALTFICWALWESHAKQVFILRADLFFIIPAVILTLLTAYSAHRRLLAL
jgi:tetratricopeptide (TPR) repeat protein